MKKGLLLVLGLCLFLAFAGRAEAYGYEVDCDSKFFSSILNECNPANHEPTVIPDDNRHPFDYGLFAEIIVKRWDDGNYALKSWNTYEFQRNELTTLVGVTIDLDKIIGW